MLTCQQQRTKELKWVVGGSHFRQTEQPNVCTYEWGNLPKLKFCFAAGEKTLDRFCPFPILVQFFLRMSQNDEEVDVVVIVEEIQIGSLNPGWRNGFFDVAIIIVIIITFFFYFFNVIIVISAIIRRRRKRRRRKANIAINCETLWKCFAFKILIFIISLLALLSDIENIASVARSKGQTSNRVCLEMRPNECLASLAEMSKVYMLMGHQRAHH